MTNRKQLLRKANKWWTGTDFPTMERITGYRQDFFDPHDGYEDFIIACDEWWKDLPAKDKIRIYNEYN